MGAVARGPSAPLRVNPSRLRVNEWGERNSRREADPSAVVGMTDGERKLETRRQRLEPETRK